MIRLQSRTPSKPLVLKAFAKYAAGGLGSRWLSRLFSAVRRISWLPTWQACFGGGKVGLIVPLDRFLDFWFGFSDILGVKLGSRLSIRLPKTGREGLVGRSVFGI